MILLKIKEIMTDNVATVSPETTVVEAARLMQRHDIGSLPVCEGPDLVGIVTDRDIVVGAWPMAKISHTSPQVMARTVVTASPRRMSTRWRH